MQSQALSPCGVRKHEMVKQGSATLFSPSPQRSSLAEQWEAEMS